MPKFVSGKAKRKPQSQLSVERYQYLGLDEAEPNLGDPLSAESLAESIPGGQQYQIVSIAGYPGERYWIPTGGGLIPGSITVLEENSVVPPNGVSSITQLNFVGNAITVEGHTDYTSNPSGQPGVIATITVAPTGNNNEIIFVDSGDFGTSADFTFNKDTGELIVDTKTDINGNEIGGVSISGILSVGVGGTIFTAKSVAGIVSVGIGTSNPEHELHVQGDVKITGTIYDSLDQPGSQNQIIVKTGNDDLLWVNQSTIQAGAGGTIYNVQYHNAAGLVDGADDFVFNASNSRVGIGTTIPEQKLQIGTKDFYAEFTKLGTALDESTSISGIDTTGLTPGLYVRSETVGIVTNDITRITSIDVGVVNLDHEIAYDSGTMGAPPANVGRTFYFGPIDYRDVAVVTGVGSIGIGSHLPTANLDVLDLAELDSVNVSVALTAVDIDVTGHAEFDDVNVSTALTAKDINVTGKLTGNVDIDDLYVIGVSTFTNQVGIGSTTILGTEQTGHLRVVGFSTFWKVGIDTHLDVTGIATAQFGDIILGGSSTDSDKIRSNSGKIVSDDKLEITSATDSSENDGAIHTDGGISGKNLYIKEDSTLGKRVDVVFTPLYGFTAGQGILTATSSHVTDVQIGDYLQPRNESSNTNALISPNTKVTSVTAIANNRTEIGISNPVAVTESDQLEITILDVNGSSSHDLTIHSFVDSHIRPDSNNTYDLGTESLKWRDIYGTTFHGAFSGTVTDAAKVETKKEDSSSSDHYLTFVVDNNTNATSEPVFTNTNIKVKPSENKLIVGGPISGNSLEITNGTTLNGDTTLGDASSDKVTFTAKVDSNIIPTGTKDIGGTNDRWGTIYATDLNISGGNLTAVNYEIGDLKVTGITTLGDNASQDKVIFNSKVDSDILPSVNTKNIGATNDRWGTIYATDLNVSSGSLTAVSYEIGNLKVTGITTLGSDSDDTLTINAKVNTNIIPTGSTLLDLGGAGTEERWGTIYATDLNVSGGSLSAVDYEIGNLNVTGITTLGDSALDTLTINAKVDSSIIPKTNTTGTAITKTSLSLVSQANQITGINTDNITVGMAVFGNTNVEDNTFVTSVTNAFNDPYDAAEGIVNLDRNLKTIDPSPATNQSVSFISPNPEVDLGTSQFRFRAAYIDSLYIDSLNGTVGGTVENANKVAVIQRDSGNDADHYITFVDSNNTESSNELLYTESNLAYNPETDILKSPNLNITGTAKIEASGGLDVLGITTFTGEIKSNIVPGTDGTYNLGSSSKKWANMYVDNVVGSLTGAASDVDVLDNDTDGPQFDLEYDSSHGSVSSLLDTSSPHSSSIPVDGTNRLRGSLRLSSSSLTAAQAQSTYSFIYPNGNVRVSWQIENNIQGGASGTADRVGTLTQGPNDNGDLYFWNVSFDSDVEIGDGSGTNPTALVSMVGQGQAGATEQGLLLAKNNAAGISSTFVTDNLHYNNNTEVLYSKNTKTEILEVQKFKEYGSNPADVGTSNQVIMSDGSGGWSWQTLTSTNASGVISNIILGIDVYNEDDTNANHVGVAATALIFTGSNVNVAAHDADNTLAEITIDDITIKEADFSDPAVYSTSNNIQVTTGSEIGIKTTSNAHGKRFIQDSAPSASDGNPGDIWYDTSGATYTLGTFDIASLPTLP